MPTERSHHVEGNRHRRILHLAKSWQIRYQDVVAQQSNIPGHRHGRKTTPVMQVKEILQIGQCGLDIGTVWQQIAHQPQGLADRVISKEQAKMRASTGFGTRRQQFAECDQGNRVFRIGHLLTGKSRLHEQWIQSDTEPGEHRLDINDRADANMFVGDLTKVFLRNVFHGRAVG